MKMSITVAALLASTSRARMLDVVADLEKVLADHKCRDVHITLGIVPADTTVKGKDNDGNEQAGRERTERTERGQAAADDFAADEAPGGDDGKPGRKPRSDAGKPRGKRGAAEGSAAEGPERGSGRSEAGDAAGGNGSRRAPRGGDQGRGEGREGERGGEGSGGRTGRARDRDGKAAEVEAADEDWGADDGDGDGDLTNMPAIEGPEFDSFEEGEAWWAKTPDSDGWPDSLMPEGDLNRAALSTIMSDHFRANGGKSKKGTFDLLAEVTGAEDLNKVHADDFDKLARAMLRDTAKLRHGVKKPGAK